MLAFRSPQSGLPVLTVQGIEKSEFAKKRELKHLPLKAN